MKKTIIVLAVLFVSTMTFAQTWTLDKSHAKLGFEITHLMISETEGLFNSFDAKITSSKENFSDAIVELTVEASSINTSNEDRDKHLRNEDFFEVEKYKTITFKSTSVKQVEGKKYKLAGNLTMHGVTKPVVLDAIITGPVVHPFYKKNVIGLKISGTINRTDFGIGMKFNSAVLGEEVIIKANGEFLKN